MEVFMFKEGMVLAALAGVCVGAVIVTVCKPARDMVEKGVEEIEEKIEKVKSKAKDKLAEK